MAVYTDIEEDALHAFLAHYDIGALTSYKGIAEGVENSNFLIQTTQDNFILTLYEQRVNADDLPFFMGLKEHLAQKGLSVPRPVRNRSGVVLGHLAGRPAATVTFLEGMWPRKAKAHHCRAVGEAMAKLHIKGADFHMEIGRVSWRVRV